MKSPLWLNGFAGHPETPGTGAPEPGQAPWSAKDFTPEVLDFLRSVHGRVRRDDLGDYYYEHVSTISLHLLLNSSLPPKEVLWSWYDYFDREHSESIYQTLPPLKDEAFLRILEGCGFLWNPERVRDSGLIFLSRHRKAVYAALEEFLTQRLEAHRTMEEEELRAFLTPRNTWSDRHLGRQVLRMRTLPLPREERQAVYRRFNSDYLRATARHLMDEATSDLFWKAPPPQLEAIGALFSSLVGILRETSIRMGAYVSREAYEREHWREHMADHRHDQRGGSPGGPGGRQGSRGGQGSWRHQRRTSGASPARGSLGGVSRDHFLTLGLTPEATEEEVKAAYRERVKQEHPDQGGDVREFMRIQEAYEFLLTEVF